MSEKFKYDAFISYRHLEKDMFVAQTLHRTLEEFKLPKNLWNKCEKKGITRVFRDRDELPLASDLSEPITEALENSQFLIVICTPQLKESIWCRREIETFKSLHGREKIFAVLAEGEPEDSFPEELVKAEVEKIDANGNKTVEIRDVEPLAADVRGLTKKEIRKKIKEESIRLIAPMFNLGYDELKQRHREQKLRKTIKFVSAAAAVLLIFGIVSTSMAITIHRQSKEMKRNYAETLCDTAVSYMEKGDKNSATDAINQAVEYASDSVKVKNTLSKINSDYVANGTYVLDETIKSDSGITQMLISPSGKKMALADVMGNISVYDNDRKTLTGLSEKSLYFSPDYALFTDDDHLVYSTASGVVVCDISSDSCENLYPIFAMVSKSDDNEKFAILSVNTGIIYDMNSLEKITEFETPYQMPGSTDFSDDGSKLVIAQTMEDASEAIVVDANNGKKICDISFEGFVIDTSAGKDKVCFSVCNVKDEVENTLNHVEEYSINTGEKLWESDNIPELISYTDYTENTLYTFAASGITLYASGTGEILDKEACSDMLLNTQRINPAECGRYYYITNKGDALWYDADSKVSKLMYSYSIHPTMDIDYSVYIDDSAYFHFMGQDYVSVYRPIIRDDVAKYDGPTEGDGKMDVDGVVIFPLGAINAYGQWEDEAPIEKELYSLSARSYDNKYMVSYSPDKDEARLYKKGDKEPYGTLKVNLGFLSSVFFSADNKYVYVNYQDGSVELYDIETLELFKKLESDYQWLYYIAFVDEFDAYIINTARGTVLLDKDFEEITSIDITATSHCIGYDTNPAALLIQSGDEVSKIPY